MRNYTRKTHKPGLRYDYINGKWNKHPMPQIIKVDESRVNAIVELDQLQLNQNAKIQAVIEPENIPTPEAVYNADFTSEAALKSDAADAEQKLETPTIEPLEVVDLEQELENVVKGLVSDSWNNFNRMNKKKPLFASMGAPTTTRVFSTFSKLQATMSLQNSHDQEVNDSLGIDEEDEYTQKKEGKSLAQIIVAVLLALLMLLIDFD